MNVSTAQAVTEGYVVDPDALEHGCSSAEFGGHAFSKNSPVQGRGLFASKDLSQGDLILREKPVLAVETDSRFRDPPDEIIEDLIRKSKSVPGIPEIMSQLAGMNASSESSENTFTAATFRTHNFFIEDKVVYGGRNLVVPSHRTFHGISLANHSCSPNAYTSWRSSGKYDSNGQLYLFALCPIAKGEEIFVCYVESGQGTWRPSQQRQSDYSGYWGFTCECEVCADPRREQTREERLALLRRSQELEAEISAADDDKDVLVPASKVWEQCQLRLQALKLMYSDLGGSLENNQHLKQVPSKVNIHLVEEYEKLGAIYVEMYKSMRHENRSSVSSGFAIAVRLTAMNFYALSDTVHCICHGSDTPGRSEREINIHSDLLTIDSSSKGTKSLGKRKRVGPGHLAKRKQRKPNDDSSDEDDGAKKSGHDLPYRTTKADQPSQPVTRMLTRLQAQKREAERGTT